MLEAFAILVALRHWCDRWRGRRVRLSVQTDNMAALTLLCKMQPHSARLGLLAREVALDIAASSYTPDVAAHIPGISKRRLMHSAVAADPIRPPYQATWMRSAASMYQQEEGFGVGS